MSARWSLPRMVGPYVGQSIGPSIVDTQFLLSDNFINNHYITYPKTSGGPSILPPPPPPPPPPSPLESIGRIIVLTGTCYIVHDIIVNNCRDYNDALIERLWDKQVRTGNTLVLESIKTLLNGKVGE